MKENDDGKSRGHSVGFRFGRVFFVADLFDGASCQSARGGSSQGAEKDKRRIAGIQFVQSIVGCGGCLRLGMLPLRSRGGNEAVPPLNVKTE